MHPCFRPVALAFAGLLFTAQALATNAGWQSISVPGLTPDVSPIPVVLYYPTQAAERVIPMGPFTVQAAIGAPPDAAVKGLIVLSHGTGGSELGHTSLAQALARHGYLVAALRHPGDNWQDRSLLQTSAERYFTERPQHVSRVIDALLRDPAWGQRIAKDAQGPRIGALGHSAGGYTVLALAGGEPDVSRIAAHCDSRRAEDPIFCGMGRQGPAANGAAISASAASAKNPKLADTRVRAVAAMAPVGVVFSAASLAKIRVPVAIHDAEQDRFLVKRFHADWITRNLPAAERHPVPNAWHYAFMDTPSMPIPTEDGDISANPPGFDRQAYLRQLARALPAFFDKAWLPQ